jgi:pectate lyase
MRAKFQLSFILIFLALSCVDKSGEIDLNPKIPIGKEASNEDDDNGPKNPQAKAFPVFPGGVLAFPSAEGYGKNAVGGREGEVYHVTNLNDSGQGSFRDAISKPNRIIVFDVSGIIKLSSSPLVLQSNQTILGQTAPGDGVVLYGGRLSASGAHNTIIRYLRVRMGAGFSSQADAAGIANGSNIIFDHCSFTWGRDENFSINGDGKGTPPQNITIQNSIIGHGLQNHSCGGLIQTGITEGITIFRNLYINNNSRNPKVKGLNQFVNNVVYNWGSGTAYDMGGDSEGPSETTIEDNYFIVGLGKNYRGVEQGDGSIVTEISYPNPSRPFSGGNNLFRTFWRGNYFDNNKDGTLNGRPMDWAQDCSGSPTFLDARSDLHPQILSQTSAERVYEWIVENVGASLPKRDQVDAYLVDELTSLGTKGTIIRNETNTGQFPLGGPGTIQTGNKPLDTDDDGIPDEFEDKWGLDIKDPSDAMKIASNGYTNIENYVFSLEYPDEYKIN